jgi:hypothetical protein
LIWLPKNNGSKCCRLLVEREMNEMLGSHWMDQLGFKKWIEGNLLMRGLIRMILVKMVSKSIWSIKNTNTEYVRFS